MLACGRGWIGSWSARRSRSAGHANLGSGEFSRRGPTWRGSSRSGSRLSSCLLGARSGIGLWAIVLDARRLITVSDDSMRNVVVETIQKLLAEQKAVAGFPASDGLHFVPWLTSPEQTALRTGREWHDLGRDPGIGEVVWLSSPDRSMKLEGRSR